MSAIREDNNGAAAAATSPAAPAGHTQAAPAGQSSFSTAATPATKRDWIERADLDGLSRTQDRGVRLLMQALYQWLGDSQAPEEPISYAEIAERVDCSLRTAKRYVALAEELGLLVTLENRQRWGRQAPNAYRICWDELERRTREPGAISDLERGTQLVPDGTQVVSRGTQLVPAGTHKKETRTPTPSLKQIEPPPPPQPVFAPADPLEQEWRQVEGEILSEGVVKAAEAVRLARDRGVSPDMVAEIIAHYRASPGAWGQGALYHRVRDALPGLPASSGWPGVHPDFARRQLPRGARVHDAGQTASRRTEELRGRYAELAGRYGVILSRMTPTEKQNLAGQLAPDDAAIYATIGGQARWTMLLEQLERNDQEASE